MLTQTYTSRIFSLEYPRVWEMEMHDNIPAFFDPISGKGALQILALNSQDVEKNKDIAEAYPYMSGKNLKDKMTIFLHLQNINYNDQDLKIYKKDSMDFIPYEYSSGGRFYMVVMMEHADNILLALYNSSEVPTDEEALILGNMINSIRFTAKGN